MKIADKATAALLSGGVIAYPTEGVFGLGCLPDNSDALRRLLQIKQRDSAKGLILIAATGEQLLDWIELPAPDPAHPVTWIVPASSQVHRLVRGDNVGLAVRITTHPVAAMICNAVDSAIVSTSANLSGKPVAADALSLRRQFRDLVDYVVPGECGPVTGASEIRHLVTGEVLRPRQSE